MTRARAAALALAVAGCSGQTQVTPRVVAPDELTLRYDERTMVIYAGDRRLTEGPRYLGLEQHVRCVPRAREHARYARRHGRARVGLAWAGGALGVASLGSLGGIALLDDNPTATFGILGAGLGVAVLGIVLAGASRSAGNQAHGNAIDALNYYNDAVGSLGGSCDRAAPTPMPTRVVPAAPGPAAAPVRGGAIEVTGAAAVEGTSEVASEAPGEPASAPEVDPPPPTLLRDQRP